MIQGFTWESASRNHTERLYNWYSIMKGNAENLQKFEYVWFPPPSKSLDTNGYLPTELNVLDSFYGKETELKDTIKSIEPAKAIADVVINHRCGSSGWGKFINPSLAPDYTAICSDDEGFFEPKSDMYNSSSRGKKDTGDKVPYARDIDHTNKTVQKAICDWMNSILKGAGFIGWRYDMVKGYDGEYVGLYNKATCPYFSVGEFWNESNREPISKWVEATVRGGGKSRAFDFTLKGSLNRAFNEKNFALLADEKNLYISQPRDAVTFVDNHDTGSTQHKAELQKDYIAAAYALILTHPGYPCVAWQHYFSDLESGGFGNNEHIGNEKVSDTTTTYRELIDSLMLLRKESGIKFDSTRKTLLKENYAYAAYIKGERGSIITSIGDSLIPMIKCYTLLNAGKDFAVWKEKSAEGGKAEIFAVKNVGEGQAIYFIGNFEESKEGNEDWKKAVRGKCEGGHVWSACVTLPASGTFEWKAIKAKWSNEKIIQKSKLTDLKWQKKNNNIYPASDNKVIGLDFD